MLDLLGKPSKENVIVLHGPPGVGKSELALEFARRQLDKYPGGTFFIGAGAAVAIELAGIGRSFLDLDFPADLSLEEQFLQTLGALAVAPSLLIFDDVRSVDEAERFVPPAGTPCHVIVTTVLDRWDGGLAEELTLSPSPKKCRSN